MLLCCAVMLLCAALPSAAQEPASALRNRLVRRPKAVKTPSEEASVFAARGDACRAQGDTDCACDAYLEALRIDANASALAGADALRCDPFSRAYAFAPGLSAADEFYPGERSGIVLAIGLGNQFSGVGAHAAWIGRSRWRRSSRARRRCIRISYGPWRSASTWTT